MKPGIDKKLQDAGIIVALPGDLPLATIIPIADALLASPILAVDVAFGSPELPNLLHDFRQRGGNRLVIGVRGVETAAQLKSLPLGQIDYFSSTRFDHALLMSCQKERVTYVPGVISFLAAQAAQQRGCRTIRLRTGGPDGADYVRTVHEVQPDLGLIVETEAALGEVDRYRKAGAAALVVSESVFTGPEQTMTDLIKKARAYCQAWQN